MSALDEVIEILVLSGMSELDAQFLMARVLDEEAEIFLEATSLVRPYTGTKVS